MVLFGGDFERNFLSDTWKFVGGQWTNVSATAGGSEGIPPCRLHPARQTTQLRGQGKSSFSGEMARTAAGAEPA